MNTVEETGPRRAGVAFSGSTGEDFKIWIVNVALTVVTLGIYSAWAKVRKLRYFYGNTSIEDGNFDYHAKPKAILIGRLIAVGFLLFYYLSSQYVPILGYRILRGGSWYFSAQLCRSAHRTKGTPSLRHEYLGLRVAAIRTGESAGEQTSGSE